MITEKRRKYLKEWRIKNKQNIQEYSTQYHKIWYQNKKKGVKETISISQNSRQKEYNNNFQRKCCRCNLLKEISLFSKNRTKPLGYDYSCIECTKKRKWSKTKRAPQKIKAKRIFQKYLYSGKITTQPCIVCGSLKVDGHHEDYSKPLDIIWLCRKHHQDRHVELRKNGVKL